MKYIKTFEDFINENVNESKDQPKINSKDYHEWYEGKKEIFRKAYCDKCRGDEGKIKKTCIMHSVGGGTLSNPSGHEWLCKKHFGSDKLWLKYWNNR